MEKVNSYLTKLLLTLGFAPRHNGFNYLREILWLSYSKGEKLGAIYPRVALAHNQLSSSVQTAVRHAVKTAQFSENFNYVNTLMGAKITSKMPLAPSEFVSLITEYLKYLWDGNV